MKQIFLILLLILNAYIVDLFAQTIPLVYDVENTGASCTKPPLPTISQLQSYAMLPDPFGWSNKSGRISSFNDWTCRRAEIKAEIENYEIGVKPPRPTNITATYSGGTLTVTVTENGKTLTLTSQIVLPSGAGPFPAVIGMNSGTGSLPATVFSNRNIARITYNHDQVTTYNNKSTANPFYQLYPNLASSGQYSAWAWGVSRIIDGLELVKAQLPIDLKHIAVTGCSYAGKMALFAGALDERIALTIPQESGGGGCASWRFSETMGDVEKLGATNHQWFMESMFQFAGANVTKLPHDHHELMAMIAPRALLVLANGATTYGWLAEESGYVSCRATEEIYKTLGVSDRFGFSHSAHTHCSFPSDQNTELAAFVDKFLLGQSTNTTGIAKHPFPNTDYNRWITAWKGLVLSNNPSNTPPNVSITAPLTNANFNAPATITIDANATDANGTVSNVQFFNGATLLGSDATSPYSFSWSNVVAGTYTLTAKATDNAGAVTTSTAVTVVVNAAPVAQTPFNGMAAMIPGIIQAEQYDLGGEGISFHETTTGNSGNSTFRNGDPVDMETTTDGSGGINVGWIAAGEWLEYTVNVTTAGTYSLGMRVASDAARTMHIEMDGVNISGTITVPNTGGFQTFQTVTINNINLTAGQKIMRIAMDASYFNINYVSFLLPNTPPVVSIIAPSNNTSFTAPASIAINANATDADGTVSNVQFFNGTNLLGTDVTSPYSFSWGNVAAGTYTLTAKATDNAGAVTTSASITIVVNPAPNVPPTVSITSPLNTASFTAPAVITINANAADSNGTVSNVQFFNGTTLLGTDVTSPYSFSWGNVAAGTYTLTAKATDNAGAVTTSAVITIVVNPASNVPPTVSITAPLNNTSFTAPATIRINANATDIDGTVSNVQFFNGTTLLGSDATSPYSFTWSSVAAGTYFLTVVATDNIGATTTSSIVAITVNSAPTAITIQAETACLVNGTLNETINTGFNGTGYVNTDNAVGASATWNINSASAQTITLGIRYAHNTAAGRSMSLSVNNTTQVANIPFPSTGNTNWTVTNVQVNLIAGINIIKLISLTAAGSPYLDELIYNSTGVSAASCTTPNVLPTVSITAPLNNASFTAPAAIMINANAADTDGTVSNVQFYNGTTLLGSDATSPYSFSWNNVVAGTYALTARATDNSGAVVTSSSVTIGVNPPTNISPTVSISAPLNNTTFTAPAAITINATAADADGTVSNVQFYNGTTLLGSDATSPYSFSWSNVVAGTYSLTARATDNAGAVTTSSSISITVTTTTTVDPNFHIYLCFGQSNMEGQGTIEAQDQTVNSRFRILQSVNCSGQPQNTWRTATPPLSRCNTKLGPADYFGREMINNLPSNVRVGIVHVSIAGCKIELFDKNNYATYVNSLTASEQWMKDIINQYGGNPYAKLVELAKLAQKDGVIKGILLHQGESNSGDQAWPTKVKGVYTNLLTDLGLNASNVPLLAGQVVDAAQGGATASMNTIINQLPNTIPTARVISSSGCTDQADNLHFTSAGYRLLGTRYAQTMLTLLGNNPGTPQTPFNGSPSIIPGTIQAEHYDVGGEGISFHETTTGNSGNSTLRGTDPVDMETTTDGGAGINVGWIESGEWLEYTVNVSTSGVYRLTARVASDAARTFHVEMDGVNISGTIAVPNTGGFQTFQTVTINTINLTAGQKIMRIAMDASYFNLNYLTFAMTSGAKTGISEELSSSISPNPSDQLFTLSVKEDVESFTIINNQGVEVHKGGAMKEGESIILGDQLSNGIYVLMIQYNSGEVEKKKIMKIK